MKYNIAIISLLTMLWACSSGKAGSESAMPEEGGGEGHSISAPAFDRDSAYSYVETLVSFGPRVPNTEAHRRAGDWLTGKFKSFGLPVIEQRADLTAFDGTVLKARNIFAQINPEASERILLLAHWDCRPWADEDADPKKHRQPVDGANDGASGVGVLLEIARQLSTEETAPGVDILLVDAEDWGTDGDDTSWALGTAYFAENPPLPDYKPTEAILLDMVGSPDASFGYEYFSAKSNPALLQKLWSGAQALGHTRYFHTGFGGAVTDDHIELIKRGIPAVDILDYRNSDSYQGFDPVWHTSNDGMQNISPRTLGAVGETVLYYLNNLNNK